MFMSSVIFSFLCSFVHIPFGPRKSGMFALVLIPAPVNIIQCLLDFISFEISFIFGINVELGSIYSFFSLSYCVIICSFVNVYGIFFNSFIDVIISLMILYHVVYCLFLLY